MMKIFNDAAYTRLEFKPNHSVYLKPNGELHMGPVCSELSPTAERLGRRVSRKGKENRLHVVDYTKKDLMVIISEVQNACQPAE